MTDWRSIFDLFLPDFLRQSDREALFAELRGFPTEIEYYATSPDLMRSMLQGDGWSGVVVLDYVTGARDSILCAVISNSCDVAPDNPRRLPYNVLVVPLVSYPALVTRLQASGVSPQSLRDTTSALMRQEWTAAMYFPPNPAIPDGAVALLDSVQSIPYAALDFVRLEKRWTLSQLGFYVFVLKLSIHFTRLGEGFDRLVGVPAEPV